jgi:hypothetical protein
MYSSESSGFQLRTPNLGGRRGPLSDWITQRWVQFTGKRVALKDHPWLEGPVGDVEVIGSAFFRRLAEKKNLQLVVDGKGRGLVENFSLLRGPTCDPDCVDRRVTMFYENTADFDFDVWSEWCGAFRPFGGVLAAVFSRRLQQLNVPLSPLDTKLGITSDVVQLRDQFGRVVYTAWVRDVVSTGRTLYAGTYSVCRVPGYGGPCVKVVFPLPNGNAIVIMRPESEPNGSFTLRSAGVRFGDPGFYFFVESEPGFGWARHVRTFQERIRVYVDPRGIPRADHELWIWGARFLQLHYRMRRRDAPQENMS